ncbi:MAG: hypothetical protein J7578_25340, partial [Chitinophagaceae bacterium]|nr:hypothetical protein [Chitinophagaceae bacterium]
MQRVEANWSSDITAGLGKYAFAGHDGNYNWQASTSFAEEGKRKSVVQYFDGSLRNRQTITKDNTTNKTIIAESFYDYQGRPVIQVLPSPSLSSIIQYTPRFNSINNNNEYDKDLYDKEYAVNDACEAGAPPLDSASGAAQYYSASNPLAGTGIHQFIPKAKGYPFTEVRYLPDNTNRVSVQSGVGDEFQIGKHATRNYYGTPEQEELDALFGTEVGLSSHYFKNMVRDANGQYSVSYVDMLGRTIATALAGDSPASLEKLSSNKEVKVVKKLLDENNNVIKGTSIESSRSLLVPKKGDYTFKYSLIPDSLTIKDCQNIPVCYDCRYDLEITITDECGKTIKVIQKNNVSLETNCGTIAPFPSVDETVNLEEGNYLVTKKLTINKAAMDYYRSVFLAHNSCKSYESFLEEQKTALASFVCEPSCANCTAQLGDRTQFTNNYFNALNVPVEERTQRIAEADRAYDRLKRDCDALCNRMDNNQNIKEMMLADVSPPNGQYANLSNVDQCSIFYPSAQHIPRYMDIGLGYVNEKGNLEFPQQFAPAEFVSRFKSSYAEALLKLHPEYNKLLKYQQIEANSNGWESMFQQTETYQEAVAKGFLNPANFSGLPARPEFAHNPAYADPIFANIDPSEKGKLKDSLDWKTGMRQNEVRINAWCLATLMAHCKTEDQVCFDTYRMDAQAFNLGSDCTGEL